MSADELLLRLVEGAVALGSTPDAVRRALPALHTVDEALMTRRLVDDELEDAVVVHEASAGRWSKEDAGSMVWRQTRDNQLIKTLSMIDQSKAVNNWQTLCGFWQSGSSVSMYEYMEIWRYVWRYMAVWFICIKQQMFVWRYMVNELWFLSRFNLNRQPKVTGGKGCCMEISVFV